MTTARSARRARAEPHPAPGLGVVAALDEGEDDGDDQRRLESLTECDQEAFAHPSSMATARSAVASAAARHGRGTVQDLDDTLLRALFASPPSEFVAARNELAKQLRRDKRREEATAVAALRRPGWDDWALNVTAVEQGADVASFADAASAVRAAQAAAIEGRDGPDVRTTLHDLRTATTVLVRHATAVLRRVGRQAGAGELAGRLAEVAASEPAVDQLRVGVLGAGGDAPAELFAGLEPGDTRDAAASRSRSRRRRRRGRPVGAPRRAAGR